MSKETLVDLNSNALIGFTEKRGKAWHYRAGLQGDEPNHYPGAIPADDVLRRLFNWKPVEAHVTVTWMNEDGAGSLKDKRRKAIVRPDNGTIFAYVDGQPGEDQGFKIHGYEQWLLRNVDDIVDQGGLSIGSAGLLQKGGLAWVAFETPETLVTPEGVEFRPFILAATSLNTSLSSIYGKKKQLPICDNTLSSSLGERGQQIRIKHTRNSELRLADAREALGIIHSIGDEFSKEVATLTAKRVTKPQWAKFVDVFVPIPEGATARKATIATQKREQLTDLYTEDERVAPWTGTAFGVLQAVNTWRHHYGTVRGATRPERNMMNAIRGAGESTDRRALEVLAGIQKR